MEWKLFFINCQDSPDDGPELVPSVPWRHGRLHHAEETRGWHHPHRGRPHVDLLPVHDLRGPPQDPHCHAHHHLQEDLRQHGHPVEVGFHIIFVSGTKTLSHLCLWAIVTLMWSNLNKASWEFSAKFGVFLHLVLLSYIIQLLVRHFSPIVQKGRTLNLFQLTSMFQQKIYIGRRTATHTLARIYFSVINSIHFVIKEWMWFNFGLINFPCFRYARLYLAIQFFDSGSLLPPPFTYLTIILYVVRWASRTRRLVDMKMSGVTKMSDIKVSPAELEYRNLIFAFIDNCKPTPKKEQVKGKTTIQLEN